MRGTAFVEPLVTDLAYAFRTLRRTPLFTLVAVLSLTLGIGANTALFSLIDALLLRSLPVADPAGLVAVGDPTQVGSLSRGSLRNEIFSYPMYKELQERNRVFSGLLASGRSGRLTVGALGGAGGETVRGRLVSGNYFTVLGVPAYRGRTFTAADDRAPGSAPYAVVSHDYWQRRMGGEPGALGRVLVLNGHSFTIVGILPPGFTGDVVGNPTEVFLPASMQPQVNPGRDFLDRWDASWLLLMGRLQPGVSMAEAKAELDRLFPQIVEAHSGSSFAAELRPDPTHLRVPVAAGGRGFSRVRQELAKPLFILMALVAMVLVMASVNVANLLLERAMGRQREITVRLSLGGGRGRLVRQLLTESLLLAAMGGALGLLFAFWAGRALLALMTSGPSAGLGLHPDLRVLGFTLAVSLATGLLFGLAPALRASRVELATVLRQTSRGVAGGRWQLGQVLVVVQFAVSLLLLVGAGLFVRTLGNLQKLDLGYPRERILMVGVEGATYSENGLFSGTESATTVRIEGYRPASGDEEAIPFDRVGPRYFEAVGISVLRGRGIGPRDDSSAPGVAVVNEALEKRYFPHGALGRHLTFSGPPADRILEIVGVSHDARDHELRGEIPPRFYLPAEQGVEGLTELNVEIRAERPAALVEPVRRAIKELGPELPATDPKPLAAMIDETIHNERTVAKLSGAFGVVALILAAVGLYGVISYAVSRRTQEIGIRMALGAARSHTLRMVVRETLVLAVVGIALGVPLALFLARLVASHLFGLSPADPVTIAGATFVLILVAVLAGAIPGSRATRVEPVEALRRD
jgi:hypothetical protein